MVGGALDVVGHDRGGEGEHLEVLGRVAGARAGESLVEVRLVGVDGAGGEEDREPSVGDLGGEGDVLRALGAHDDRDLLAERMGDGLEGLAQSGAARVGERVVGAVVGDDVLPGDDLAHDVDVLAGAGQRLLEGLAVPAFDDLGAGHAEPEDEPAAGEVVHGDGGHAHGGGRAGRQLAQGGTQADPLGLRAPPGQRGEGVGAVGLGGPDRVVAQALGLGDQLDGVGGRPRSPVPQLQSDLQILHGFLPRDVMHRP